MKRILTLFLFGILCQIGFAQSDKFLSYESMVGKTIYFYAQEMGFYGGGFTVYKLENGKYVTLASNAARRSNSLYSLPAKYSQIYEQVNGYLHVDGIIVDKKRELIKVTKGDSTYYLEKDNSNKLLSYIRNAGQWEEEVSVLNNKYNYYINSIQREHGKPVEVKWQLREAPQWDDNEVYYIANPVDGKAYVDNLSSYGRTFSYIQSHPEEHMSKSDVLLREQKQQSDLESKDALSKQGLVLVGRFYNKSIRLLEVRDSLSLFIGLEDDTNGNINLRYLRIEPSDYPAFEQKMSIVNEKFKSWAQTAKEDHVTKFKKKIPVDFDNEAGYFSMGFSNKYTYTDLYAVFEVDEKGESCLRIDNWEEYDARNSSYESQMHSPYLYFYSPEDFSKFFELMKYENAVKYYKRVKAIADSANKAKQDQDAKFN